MSTDTAKAIRAELKTAGYNRNAVSVRSRHWGSVCVTIKSVDVDYREVNKIAKSHECVSRCSYSGDILSGGNIFVSVKYSDRAIDASGLDDAIRDIACNGRPLPVGADGQVIIEETPDRGGFAVWHVPAGESCGHHIGGHCWAADDVAILLLSHFGPSVAEHIRAARADQSWAGETPAKEEAEPMAEVVDLFAATADRIGAALLAADDLADLEAAAASATAATLAAREALDAAMLRERDALKAVIAARTAARKA